MKRRFLAAFLAMLIGAAGAVFAAGGQMPRDASADTVAAAVALQSAIAALNDAATAPDRVPALTAAILGYEAGVAALRGGLRATTLRENALAAALEADRARVSRLLGVLSATRPDAVAGGVHPGGPIATVRATLLLEGALAALRAESDALRVQVQDIADLRAIRTGAADTLTAGATAMTGAHAALGQAVADRTDLPRRVTESATDLAVLVATLDTMESFTEHLSDSRLGPENPVRTFADAQGALALPVRGDVVPTVTGRTGITVVTAPGALVTTPWEATIRYRGPLLDYGNVMILEPGGGYLLVLAGLETFYGTVGQVVPEGSPVGLMGGQDSAEPAFSTRGEEVGGAGAAETLYLELRLGSEAVDTAPWFLLPRR